MQGERDLDNRGPVDLIRPSETVPLGSDASQKGQQMYFFQGF
jgi:hypothetical protein